MLSNRFHVVQITSSAAPYHLCIALPTVAGDEVDTWLPPAARPGSGRLASGRGLTAEQAAQSCLGEVVELVSASRWGDEAVRRSSFAKAGAAAIHPAQLLLASEEQYAGRTAWNARFGAFDWLPRRLQDDEHIDWVEAYAPGGGGPALVPAAFVYIGTFEAGDEAAFAVADSNGCAAGPTLEAASVAGFLEFVERDATAIWWHGAYPRPAVEAASIDGAAALLAWLSDRERRFHVLDITTDLGVPVCLAVSSERDGSAVAIGASANFDRNHAAVSALTEMLQIEMSLQMRLAQPAPAGSDGIQFWLDHVSLDRFPHLRPGPHAVAARAPHTAEGDLNACISICRDAGLRLLLVDLTRAEMGVPVVRAIVPGLRPAKARFARGRLFDVSERLGWSSGEMVASRFNRLPLSI